MTGSPCNFTICSLYTGIYAYVCVCTCIFQEKFSTVQYCVYFVLWCVFLGWCLVWKTYFSTQSPTAERWSPCHSSYRWVNTVSTLTLPVPHRFGFPLWTFCICTQTLQPLVLPKHTSDICASKLQETYKSPVQKYAPSGIKSHLVSNIYIYFFFNVNGTVAVTHT